MKEQMPQLNQEPNIFLDRPNMVKEHNELHAQWEGLDSFDRNLALQGRGDQKNIDIYKKKKELYSKATDIDKYKELAISKENMEKPEVGDTSDPEKLKQEKEKVEAEVEKIQKDIEATTRKLNELRATLGMEPSEDIPSLMDKKAKLEDLKYIQDDLDAKLKEITNEVVEYSVDEDPRFNQMLEQEAYFRLKTYDKEYFNENYSGLSESGYLIDKNGKETTSRPSMNISGKTGDLKYSEFIDITKQKFLHEYPDAKEKENRRLANEKLKQEEENTNEKVKIYAIPSEDPAYKKVLDRIQYQESLDKIMGRESTYSHEEHEFNLFRNEFPEKALLYLDKKQGVEEKINESVSKNEIQSNIETQEKYENREVSDAFKEAGMPLDWKLVGMLEESQEHQGGRRGSGFTQASRYMADIIRSERSSRDFKIFDNSFKDKIEDDFFANGNEEKLKTVDFRDFVDKNKLKEISNKIKGPGSKLLFGMIDDTFNHNIDTNLATLPSSKEKMEIGTCTTAENYFFDYMRGNTMYGNNFENKTAKMNIFKDEKGEPLFMEKIGLGENHSAISLKDFYLNGIKIPAGSLVALQYDKPSTENLTNSKNGNILESKILQAVEFLRFTTLVVEPKDREQTFGEHYKFQKEQGIKGAEDLTINEVIQKCKNEISV